MLPCRIFDSHQVMTEGILESFVQVWEESKKKKIHEYIDLLEDKMWKF